MSLATAFRDELTAAGAVSRAPQDEGDLEARLAALVARGRAAHPELPLPDLDFVKHLARCSARADTEAPRALEALAIEDLYLACACQLRVEGAAAEFEARCGGRLRAVLGAEAKSSDLRDEVEQRVRDLLLVGTVETPPKIASYGGQGPLDRWAAVVAQRQVVTVLRRDESEQRARDGLAAEAALGELPPEIALAKQRYREAFQAAMKDALGTLGERDRLLLRLHLVSGISVESIGNMYGVSQSTASRWLAKAREDVAAEAQRLLRERIGVAPSEVASLADLVASQLDLSVSRILGR
jgi:RNA polymerase sigma-70 factor (ECF subfamily)